MRDLVAIEFGAILESMSRYALTDRGRRMTMDLASIPSVEGTNVDLVARVHHLQRALAGGSPTPPGDVPDLTPMFGRLSVAGSTPDLDDLAALRALLAAVKGAMALESWDDGTSVGEILNAPPVPLRLAGELERIVRPDGSLDERAVPEIARIRRETADLNASVFSRAEALIRADGGAFQSQVPTVRDGRTVLPVRAGARGRVDGIVHGTSSSGETLFVEPVELLEWNNELVQADARIRQAIHALLRAVGDQIRDVWSDLRACDDWLVEFDLAYVRARYGTHTGGTIPQVGPRIAIHCGRHPALGRAAVPFDLELDGATKLVLISGPNTGGKTVLLKTIGLIVAMARRAIPAPVGEGSVIPPFSTVVADVGDDQSISAALSTYAAHIQNLGRICADAGPETLVLIDELGTGTDPEEGAAVSMAVLDHLLARGATVIATTHLAPLKHYGYTHAAAENAAMVFDDGEQRPTYQVRVGVLGASHAVAMAAANGLPDSVVARARELAEGRSGDLGRILARLAQAEADLEGERTALAEERSAVARAGEELARREEELVSRERALRGELRRDLERVVADARRSIEAAIRDIRERGGAVDRDAVAAARTLVAEMVDRVPDSDPKRPRETPQPIGDPVAGDRVRHRSTGREGIVHRVRRGRVEVQFGALRMHVDPSELERAGAARERVVATRAATSYRVEAVPYQTDVRGMRRDEALDVVESLIDRAVAGGTGVLAIVHGTGTGALQKAIHDYLRGRREVARIAFARPEDGGAGKTLVEFASASG